MLWVLPLLWSAQTLCGYTITLAWNPVPDAQVTAYRVHYGTGSRAYDHVAFAGLDAQATITRLSPGKTYFFAVTSVAALGIESAYSEEISYTVPAVPVTPAPSASLKPLQYHGLFYEADEVRQGHSGAFVLTATRRGYYSGYLQMGSARLPFHGQFDAQGQATNCLVRLGTARLIVQFHHVAGLPFDQLQGSVAAASWRADISADGTAFSPGSKPAPFRGAYTLLVPSQDQLGPALPAGHSFGVVHVGAVGHVRLGASLADGTKLSLGSWLSSHGRWPVYASLYAGQGSWLGWVDFTNRPTDDFHGTLSWIKPVNRQTRWYPEGFTNQCPVYGSSYSAAFGFPGQSLGPSEVTLSFGGGNLVTDFANSLAVSASGEVSNLSSNRLSLVFFRATGSFQGVVKEPASGKSLPFAGAVFQKLQAGYGLLFDGDRSSRVLLTP